MSNTKEKILLTALRLFAQDGYEAVSTSMIARELGITKGALYKHYKNKQDIFDSIIARMFEIDRARAKALGLPTDTYNDAPEAYTNVTVEEDIEYTKGYFRFWTEDEFGKNFRRMLTIEQYRNPQAKEIHDMIMGRGGFEHATNMYRKWIKEGSIKDGNPELLALEFSSVFLYLINLSDTISDIDHLENLLHLYLKRCLKTYKLEKLEENET